MPQRVYVCLMAFLGLTICNMMRFSMALVLTQIAAPRVKNVSSSCPLPEKEKKSKEILYDWDESAQGKILAGFFWGYVITQMPAGIIADLFGPRRVVFWSAFLTSIISILVGPITKLAEFTGLLILRILLGLMQKIKFTEMPWKQITTTMPVYALTIAIWGHCWGLFVLINNIPKYMAAVLGFDVQSNGIYLGGAYIVMTITAFGSGFLVDWMQKKDIMSITWNRVLFTSIASVLPSLGLLGVVYSGCNGTWAFISLIVGMGGMGTFYPSLKVNGIDLSTNYGGTVGSMSHWLGTTAGALGPPLVAEMAPDSTIPQYKGVMWLSFILMSVTNIFYVLFASGNVQKFNYYEPPDK